MNNQLIFDFETLSQNQQRGVVASLALLNYSTERFLEDPYNFDELFKNCHYIKFDVQEQVKVYKRVVDKDTIDWWMKQGDKARKQIAPSGADRSITELEDFLMKNVEFKSLKKIYTRGGQFDPNFIESILKACDKEIPFRHVMLRDTRSYLEGMGEGIPDFKNDFELKSFQGKFIKHDPRSDIVADVLRMQAMVRLLRAGEWEG